MGFQPVKSREYEDDLPYDDYLARCNQWLKKCYDWLKPDGRICLNVPIDINRDGRRPIGPHILEQAIGAGFQYNTTLIWNKGNVRHRAWGSWKSASAPSVITKAEFIFVLYKEVWNKQNKGESDISRDDFLQWTSGMWAFSGEHRKKTGHPAPFPLELPTRCVQLFSYVGDTVLDPFMGSGTTLIAALMHGRHAIGIDIDPQYCRLAEDRIKDEFGRAFQIELDLG